MTEIRTYASVILPLRLDWTPSYEIPQGETVSPGDWVRVDFAGRSYCGIIRETGISPDTDTGKIKPLASIERNISPVTAEEIRLWDMISEYYMCSIGEVFRVAYPYLKISRLETMARLREKEKARKQKALDKLLARAARIKARIEKKKRPEDIARLTAELRETEAGIAAITGPDIAGGTPESEAYGAGPASIVLTAAQKSVFDDIIAGNGNGKPVLVKGVTGSGKTEIYLSLAQRVMAEGRNVLYLVPEIAVSRQLGERIRTVFGEKMHTFHSEETPSARGKTAEYIRECRNTGNRYIVLGTRSAIFLPHHNLGLIIIDEEHDSSYKQDSPAPRYNGRDAAIMLSTIHHSLAVLGSATPSLESVFNARCGKYSMLTLDEKYYRAEEAEVEIIDTAAERKKRGMTGSFSRKLIFRIEETLKSGGQVLILRARRAFSPILQCPECGDIPKCPNCNVSLAYHKSPDRMVCHHCGFTAAFDGRCRKCGSRLQGLGSGTQKIEEEIRTLFPSARTARLDSDTPKSVVEATIRAFNSGETDMLVGTQIITKGFDFPGLALVAAISADSLLGLQDFRADEKALQTLEQLRGRCGRRDRKGHLVIQTNRPEHPVFRHLEKGDAENLYTELLAERKEFGYPPYTRLVNLTVKDTEEHRADMMSGKLAETLKRTLASPASSWKHETVSAPYSPSVDKIAGNHIRIIRITLNKDKTLREMKKLLAVTVAGFEKSSRYQGHIAIDADPE